MGQIQRTHFTALYNFPLYTCFILCIIVYVTKKKKMIFFFFFFFITDYGKMLKYQEKYRLISNYNVQELCHSDLTIRETEIK